MSKKNVVLRYSKGDRKRITFSDLFLIVWVILGGTGGLFADTLVLSLPSSSSDSSVRTEKIPQSTFSLSGDAEVFSETEKIPLSVQESIPVDSSDSLQDETPSFPVAETLAHSSEMVSPPQELASATNSEEDQAEELIESVMGSLAPSFELFEEYPVTSPWLAQIQMLIRQTLTTLETDPDQSLHSLQDLTALILREDKGMEAQILQDSGAVLYASSQGGVAQRVTARYPQESFTTAPEPKKGSFSEEGEEGPRELSDYQPAERLALLKTLRFQLDRRVYFWTFAANYARARQRGDLVAGRDLTLEETNLLLNKTEAVRTFFGISPVGQQWRKSFEVDDLYGSLERLQKLLSHPSNFRPVFSTANHSTEDIQVVDQEEELAAEQEYLRDRINSIQSKLHKTILNSSQKEVIENAIVSSWSNQMAPYCCDQGDLHELLLSFEDFEFSGGGDAGRHLAFCASQMKNSVSPASQKIGEAISVIYNNPNLKVYVSEHLINRLLPIRDPEFDVVQETILNNPVAGRRRTDTQVRIKLIPDDTRLLMHLYVSGKIVASTRSDVFPAQLYNQSEAAYLGRKQIEWTGNQAICSESEVAVNNTSYLNDVRTDIDFVPLIGEFTREIVRGQYQSRQGEVDQETKKKILSTVKMRIDNEVSQRFNQMNQRLTTDFFEPLSQRGLSLTLKNSRTTSDWLLASMKFGESGALGSQTTEPETLPGAFADLKVHESVLNTLLSQLDLEGRDFTVPELKAHLADVLKRPGLIDPNNENADCVFGMAEEDPISITFHENRIQLRFRFDFITIGAQSWDQVEAVVSYQPQIDSEGNAVLVRDGLISVDGPRSIRAQIPLRLLFGKAFPSRGEFSLKPKKFAEDDRFAGLSIGQCRITDGWLGLAVIQSRSMRQAYIPIPMF